MLINHELVNDFLTKFFNSPGMKTRLKIVQLFDEAGYINPLSFVINECENRVLVTIPNSPYSEIMAKYHIDTKLIFTDNKIECNDYNGYLDYQNLVRHMNKAYSKYITTKKFNRTI